MSMANEERSPGLKKLLNETFNGIQAKSSDLMKIVARLKESIIPSISSTIGMIGDLKEEIKDCKSKSDPSAQHQLAKKWYDYEKTRITSYVNYVKYSANCEMYLHANCITNFNKAMVILGEIDLRKELEVKPIS